MLDNQEPKNRAVHAGRPFAAIAVLLALVLVVVACGADSAGAEASASASMSPGAATLAPTLAPRASTDPESLCRRIDDLELGIARLRGIELKLVNRVALDIELSDVMLDFDELEKGDLGEFEDELEMPLKRLFYRLGELELAIEDFRTNPRPRVAAPHVATDAGTFADELAAFRILARC